MEVELSGLSIPYRIRRSKRVSRPKISCRYGEFTVIIPANSLVEAEKVMKDNEEWILEQWKRFEKLRKNIPKRDFCEGSSIKVMGVEREIVFECRRSNFLGDKIILANHLIERSTVKEQVEKLLRREFKKEVERRLEKYKDDFRPYNKVYIRDQRTRWGSCSSKENLSFNWRLILGPEHLIDYIVVHELAHLEHRNHGDDFWSTVGQVLPHYDVSRDWLNDNSHLLVWH